MQKLCNQNQTRRYRNSIAKFLPCKICSINLCDEKVIALLYTSRILALLLIVVIAWFPSQNSYNKKGSISIGYFHTSPITSFFFPPWSLSQNFCNGKGLFFDSIWECNVSMESQSWNCRMSSSYFHQKLDLSCALGLSRPVSFQDCSTFGQCMTTWNPRNTSHHAAPRETPPRRAPPSDGSIVAAGGAARQRKRRRGARVVHEQKGGVQRAMPHDR